MTDKSKVALAIFAVAMMLGCAIVPITATSGDTGITVTNDNQTSDGITLADIVEKIMNIGKDSDNLDLGNVALVKIDESEYNEVTIPTDIDHVVTIGDGEFGVLGGGLTYTISKGGYIDIAKGGRLVVFPTDNGDNDFTVTNTMDTFSQIVILAEPGSIITIMGISVMFVYKAGATPENHLHPLRIGWVSDKCIGSEDKPTVEFKYSKNGDTIELSSKASYTAKVHVLSFVVDGKDQTATDPDFLLNGDVTVDTEKGKISFAEGTTLKVDMRHGGDTFNLETSLELDFEFTIDCGDNTVTNDGKLKLRAYNTSFAFYSGNSDVRIEASQKEEAFNGGLSFKIINDYSGSANKRTVSISSDSTISLNAANVVITPSASKESHPTITVENLAVALSNLSTGIEMKRTSDAKVTINGGYAKADVSMTAGSLKAEYDVGIIFITLPIKLISVNDLSLSVNLSANLTDKNNWTVKSDLIRVGGELSEFLPLKSEDVPSLNNYKITMELDITNLSVVMKNGILTHHANVYVNLSTMENGLVKNAVISIENINAIKYSEDNYYVTIGKVYLKNGLPLKNILKNLVSLGDNVEIELEANSLIVMDKKIIAEEMEIHYWKYNMLDDLYVKFNTADLSYYEDDGYRLHSVSAVGYSQYKGTKSDFTMDDSEMTIRYSSSSSTPCILSVHFYSGALDFTKGGVLPIRLTVDKDVEFNANNLHVGMFFSFTENMHGTVVIDTEDGICKSKDNTTHVWLNGYIFHVNQKTTVGCHITFYLQPGEWTGKYGGYIEASKNYVLPDQPESTEEIAYYKTNDRIYFCTLLESGKGTHIDSIVCNGDGPYTLTVDGELWGDYYMFKDEVTVGCYSFGYTDGAGNVYPANPDSGEVTFTMPARNVNLTTVNSYDVNDPVIKDDTIVFDARTGISGDIAIIHSGEIKEDKTVEIIVTGADIKMSAKTFNGIVYETDGTIYIKAETMTTSESESVQKAIEGNTTYNITMSYVDASQVVQSVSYDGSTDFEVTVEVKCKDEINGFKVSYVDNFGNTETVKVKGYEDLGNNTYAVTFYANHFSTYTVEPVVVDEGSVIGATFLLVVLVALAAFCIALGGKKYDKIQKQREADAVAEGIAFLAINQGIVEPAASTEGLFIGKDCDKSTVEFYRPDKEQKN